MSAPNTAVSAAQRFKAWSLGAPPPTRMAQRPAIAPRTTTSSAANGPSPLDLLHALDGVTGAERAQRHPVQQHLQGCPGDRSQAPTPTARKIQAGPCETGQGVWRGERAILAVAGDQLSAQPGRRHDGRVIDWTQIGPFWVCMSACGGVFVPGK
jgi:hypothetical protein